MPEVYSYNEGALFLYTAAPGQTGSPQAFVQDVRLLQAWDWDRQLSPVSATYPARLTFTLKDQPASAFFRAYCTGLALFQLAKSATALNADFQLSSYAPSYASAAFRCLSGRFTQIEFQGQEGGILELTCQMTFADISAFWQ